MQAKEGMAGTLYWVLIATLVLVRAALTSDVPVQIAYFPHDDSAYVLRAFHLLQGDAFGPYDSHTLSKLPGISFWLAGVRSLGIPHLLAINALYFAAGLYFLAALRRGGAARPLLVFVFALYLFNPITLSTEWHRILREPLATGLFVVLLAAMLHLLLAINRRGQVWPHVATLSITFAFALIVREDDRLLWIALALFAVALVRAIRVRRPSGRPALIWTVVAAVLIPSAAAMLVTYSARAYIETHYRLPILHDMGEGEFPRLMAAIRSVESSVDNRLV